MRGGGEARSWLGTVEGRGRPGPAAAREVLWQPSAVRRGRHAATIVERVARQTLWVFGRGEALGEVTCARGPGRTDGDGDHRGRRRRDRIQAADAGSEARPLTTGGGRWDILASIEDPVLR